MKMAIAVGLLAFGLLMLAWQSGAVDEALRWIGVVPWGW